MAAEILEQQPEDNTLDQLPADQTAMSPEELITEFQGTDSTSQVSEEDIDALPEKYRGKSLKDIAAMHQEAERALGRQGSEVGELRKVVDTYINNQLAQQAQPTAEPEPEVDFFEDPQKAVSHAIEKHPEVQRARKAAENMERTTSLTQLQQKHPDIQSVLQDPKFVEWVQGTPMRMEMFQRADQQYDFHAADELVSNYKERTQVVRDTVQAETTARQQALKQATTGGAPAAANTAGSKRVYRRADIINLMKNDPDRYEALSGEIMLAYQEGRVR